MLLKPLLACPDLSVWFLQYISRERMDNMRISVKIIYMYGREQNFSRLLLPIPQIGNFTVNSKTYIKYWEALYISVVFVLKMLALSLACVPCELAFDLIFSFSKCMLPRHWRQTSTRRNPTTLWIANFFDIFPLDWVLVSSCLRPPHNWDDGTFFQVGG